MANKKLNVSVVIPSWNSESQLKKNLESVLLATKEVGGEIVVVDDASELDSTWEFLQSQKPKIRVYRNKNNLGFAATVNRGVALSSGRIVILLNTDVRPHQDCFKNALKLFEDKKIFAVGFNSGEDWMVGEWEKGLFHHYKSSVKHGNKNKVNKTLWASGGQAAFDKDKWDEIGGMDTIYKPFYWEDTDLGYSAWMRGWEILWSPECRVVHDHQTSVIASNYSKKYVETIATRNQFIFVWKNISDFGMLMSHLLFLPYYFLHYSRPLIQAFSKLKVVLKKRKTQQSKRVISDRDILEIWAK